MNNARLQQLEDSQTGTARKVLDAVPIQETWSDTEISVALRREGKQLAFSVVQGCLKHLESVGLVKKTPQGWRRTAPRPANIRSVPQGESDAMPQPIPTPTPSPAFDFLKSIDEAVKKIREAADDIEAAALKATEQVEAQAGRLGDFQQLATLLKRLG